jgi:cellulose synthase/poly-beta-1,6-N-acetylglucosamine synthase-like glycosyltransferase
MDENTAAPIVSVVVPAFRASHTIAATLASIFGQTFTSHEVIVVNDGSPDAAELERAIAPWRSRLRYFVQPNRGAGAARNTALRAARGRYIAFLDADDVWAPEFLRCQVAYLETNVRCDLVYCDTIITGESPVAGRRFMETAPSSGPVTLASLLAQRCNIPLSTVVVRRDRLFGVGLFDETLRRGQDFELWLRLALHGIHMAYQPLVLGEKRAWRTGLSGDPVTEIERALNVLDRFGRAHALPVEARTALRVRSMILVDRLEVEQAKRRIMEGNFAAAKYHLAAPRHQTMKLRVVLLALRVAPRLVRRMYIAVRQPLSPVAVLD